MKEFDFDELDKAVGSVLASTGQTEPQDQVAATADSTPAQVSSAQLTSPVEPVAEPTVEPPAPSVATAAPVSARPAPSVTPTRRSGRFMDVVHPGSSTGSPKQATPAISRTGSSVTPANPTRLTQDIITPSRTPAVAEPVKLPEAPERAALDTIDTPTPVNTEAASPQVAAQPSFSPFIPDAKVEKRPLGAFSSSNATETENDSADSEPEAQQTTPTNINLPPELNTEVVALESQDDPDEDDAPGLSPVGQGASLSIPQQYTNTPAEDDNTPHQVFDTEQYHPALTTATQSHKHTWLWVTLAAVILLVAAGIFGYWFVSGL